MRMKPRTIAVTALVIGLGVALALIVANRDDAAPISEANPIVMSAAETRESPLTIQKMAARTDLVVRGHVVSVNPGRVLDDAPGEPVVQIVDVVLEVEEILSGKAESEFVTIEWMAWSEGGDQNEPRRAILLNGLKTPDIGNEMVWFVSRTDGSVDGVPRYGLVSLDGLLTVLDGRVTTDIDSGVGDHEGEPRLAVRSSGMTVGEIAAAINR